ncbi:hypothetical protein [Bradyrhizobium sp. HKCCYLS20291]|uniref:hypothetical protein n=1 Tax=Bradyrhizobium sp. HKCCYLS20291 TaxID=3420766 RepID=UPI003EB9ADDF
MTRRRPALVVASVLMAATLSLAAVSAQTPPAAGLREAPSQPSPAAAVEPAPQPSNPGLVEELGKLFDKISIIPLKRPEASAEPQSTDGESAPAAQPQPAPRTADRPGAAKGGEPSSVLKETGDTLSRLAKPSSMVSGRTVCPVAANGKPDCKLGADRLCQSKGYKDGKSLNTDSAETCSAKVLIPGRQRKPDDCRTDTFVTSALCQ